MLILYPFAWLYDVVTSVRNFMYNHGLLSSVSYDLPVICIGNITVGGTGKTPHTEYLIRLLQSEGYKVAVLSRGYKRKTEGFVLATESSTAEEIGDEPLQMKRKFPKAEVAVCADRREGISRLVEESNPDVILLDDAFQHRKVKAGLNIVLMDSNRPIWKDYVLPAGRLRENKRGISRADIIIASKLKKEVGDGTARMYFDKLDIQMNQDIYFTRFSYGQLVGSISDIPLEELDKYNVLLVTGIANPKPLEEELSKYVQYSYINYSDHHQFSGADYKQISALYEQMPEDKPRIIVTTEKDAARLDVSKLQVASNSVYSVPIEVEFLRDEQTVFNKQILDYVRKHSRSSSIHS